MRFDVLTTFPEMFDHRPPAALGLSIPARARAAGLVEWVATDIRAYADNKHAKTDDRPYGGGPGMVMACQPLYDAVMAVEAMDPRPAHRVLLTPQGPPLTQPTVERLSTLPRLLLICGHYEGIDERVIQLLDPEPISLGDYVLSGGELAAMVLMDAIIRRLPGALGSEDSAQQDSFTPLWTTDPNGDPLDPKLLEGLGVPPGARLLDCPHYTRPRVWMGMPVPDVLLSGDHAAVARWRLLQRLERTARLRPDLLARPAAQPAEPTDHPADHPADPPTDRRASQDPGQA
ncbi:MAG: tRNA (guanine-N(1)-)-methyltransferase [Phycisphaerales bacterium]|nr:MAG: tRNA (guanine-N(1)-)-methyltransferase [Phycisphaerales bacterium]